MSRLEGTWSLEDLGGAPKEGSLAGTEDRHSVGPQVLLAEAPCFRTWAVVQEDTGDTIEPRAAATVQS
jgi:hypothetical protein